MQTHDRHLRNADLLLETWHGYPPQQSSIVSILAVEYDAVGILNELN